MYVYRLIFRVLVYMASSSTPTPPLAKYLASTGSFVPQIIFLLTDTYPTDKKTRDKAVKNLAAFLTDPERPHLSSRELDKLWKGIFYCEVHAIKPQIAAFDRPFSGFWMSDKALVQQALASELANIALSIDDNAASFEFLRGFWRTIVREWDGIDRLRWVLLV